MNVMKMVLASRWMHDKRYQQPKIAKKANPVVFVVLLGFFSDSNAEIN